MYLRLRLDVIQYHATGDCGIYIHLSTALSLAQQYFLIYYVLIACASNTYMYY